MHDAVAGLDVVVKFLEGRSTAYDKIFLNMHIERRPLQIVCQQLAIRFKLTADARQEQFLVDAGYGGRHSWLELTL